ncbi:hypothetical protein DMUE_2851 [Dictyocoela muelleri]|nr:hypothetical protein DMUE_2851 [Dictyocoela muelleri]
MVICFKRLVARFIAHISVYKKYFYPYIITKEQLRLSEFLGYARELLQDKVDNYICSECLGRVKWNDKEKNEVRCVRSGCRKGQPLINKRLFFNSLLSMSDILKVIFVLDKEDKAAKISLLYGIYKNSVR